MQVCGSVWKVVYISVLEREQVCTFPICVRLEAGRHTHARAHAHATLLHAPVYVCFCVHGAACASMQVCPYMHGCIYMCVPIYVYCYICVCISQFVTRYVAACAVRIACRAVSACLLVGCV